MSPERESEVSVDAALLFAEGEGGEGVAIGSSFALWARDALAGTRLYTRPGCRSRTSTMNESFKTKACPRCLTDPTRTPKRSLRASKSSRRRRGGTTTSGLTRPPSANSTTTEDTACWFVLQGDDMCKCDSGIARLCNCTALARSFGYSFYPSRPTQLRK